MKSLPRRWSVEMWMQQGHWTLQFQLYVEVAMLALHAQPPTLRHLLAMWHPTLLGFQSISRHRSPSRQLDLLLQLPTQLQHIHILVQLVCCKDQVTVVLEGVSVLKK